MIHLVANGRSWWLDIYPEAMIAATLPAFQEGAMESAALH